jgi:hypothetical protein
MFSLIVDFRYFMRELLPLWCNKQGAAPRVLDFLGGQDLPSLHVHRDSHSCLVKSTSQGWLLVH